MKKEMIRTAIDSCIWIAYKSKRDRDHEKASQVMKNFLDEKLMKAYISDYVIIEVINFLLRKASPKIAFETLDLFLKHERIEICVIDKFLFDQSCEIARKFDISLTDASIVAMMDNLDIKTLHSFDSGFDKISWIERKER